MKNVKNRVFNFLNQKRKKKTSFYIYGALWYNVVIAFSLDSDSAGNT